MSRRSDSISESVGGPAPRSLRVAKSENEDIQLFFEFHDIYLMRERKTSSALVQRLFRKSQ